MYLYDETPDDQTFKIWEWPRVEPSGDAFRNNGFCEDGLRPINASKQMGEYYIAFGSGGCASMYVNLSTGLISGCGKVRLVPCDVGTDCADCGRSASYAQQRRQLQVMPIESTALPRLEDAQEMPHLQRILELASSHRLPPHYANALSLAKEPS